MSYTFSNWHHHRHRHTAIHIQGKDLSWHQCYHCRPRTYFITHCHPRTHFSTHRPPHAQVLPLALWGSSSPSVPVGHVSRILTSNRARMMGLMVFLVTMTIVSQGEVHCQESASGWCKRRGQVDLFQTIVVVLVIHLMCLSVTKWKDYWITIMIWWTTCRDLSK